MGLKVAFDCSQEGGHVGYFLYDLLLFFGGLLLGLLLFLLVALFLVRTDDAFHL